MDGPGYAPDDPLIKFPYDIGHEGGGTVEKVGSKVKRFKPGDFVMSFNVNGTMADYTINAQRENVVQQILDITEGRGADVVAEAAGVAETVNASIECVKHNGTIVFYSWVTQDIKINISRLHHDSLQIINTGLVHHTKEKRKVWTP